MTDTLTMSGPQLRSKGRILSPSEIERTLVRLAHQIVEKNNGGGNLGLVGIRRRGAPLAERLARLVEGIDRQPVLTGALDIQLYRDDRPGEGARPEVLADEIGFDVSGRNIVLVDDVLYTGRTTRAALDALFAHGRPRRVQLAVLIDRGHRELPVEATFVGRVVPTTSRELIQVRLREIDGVEEVVIAEPAEAAAAEGAPR